MGLAALVSDALGVKPTAASGFPVESPDDRKAALGRQVVALRGPNEPANDPANEQLAQRAEARIASSDPFNDGTQGRPVQPQSNPSPFGGLAATVEGALNTAPEAPKPAPVAETSPSAPKGRFDLANAPVADTIGTLASGAGSMIAGGLHGLYKLATGAGPEAAANAVTATQEAGTHQPVSEGGKAVVGALASPWNPLNWPSAIAKKGAEALSESKVGGGQLATVVAPVAALLEGGAALVAPGVALKGAKPAAVAGRAAEAEAAKFGSVGASATSNRAALAADLATASPELKAAVGKLKAVELNPEAVRRHIEADSVGVKLTAGQATGDVTLLSKEQNARGKDKALADRFAEQPVQLLNYLNETREKAAPDVYGTNHVENGQALIDAYKETDKALRTDISAKYKALEDANGGNFPVDGKTFVANAEKMLGEKLKTEFVPAAIAKQMERFKEGAPMNFEQFEAMRTNLAAEIRKAERSGDGNAAYAAGVVRQALEDLPLGGAQSFTTMSGGAAALKPIADAARAAAKARFDLLKKDPAYRAAVNDTTAADDFINKFVVKGKAGDIKTMVEHLGPDSVAHQTMSAGAINYLKSKAGILNENGNFSQAGYNKALQELSPKLLDIVGPETKKSLETLGNVARYTQAQPRGSFVNNSNTAVSLMAEGAKSALEGAANVAAKGVPVGTWTRRALSNRADKAESMKSLQTGAGISLKDIGKK